MNRAGMVAPQISIQVHQAVSAFSACDRRGPHRIGPRAIRTFLIGLFLIVANFVRAGNSGRVHRFPIFGRGLALGASSTAIIDQVYLRRRSHARRLRGLPAPAARPRRKRDRDECRASRDRDLIRFIIRVTRLGTEDQQAIRPRRIAEPLAQFRRPKRFRRPA